MIPSPSHRRPIVRASLHPRPVAAAVCMLCAMPCLTLAGTAPPRVTLDIMQPLAGQTLSGALGLNDAGQMVGFSAIDTGNFGRRAVTWTSGGGTHVVPTLGNRDSIGWAINNSGQVVGTLDNQTAFSWQASTGLLLLAKIGNGTSAAYAVNANGQVAGTANPPGLGSRAVVWQNGSLLRDVSPSNAGYNTAYAINSAGDVVGTGAYAYSENHAFVWQAGVGPTDLGTLGGSHSEGFGINAGAQVVGQSNLSGGIVSRAFVWQRGRGMQDMGTLGGNYSYANAINDAGQAVGGSSKANSAAAFLWREGSGMSDLSLLTTNAFHLQEATAINRHAQVAGNGFLANQVQRGYLLTLHPDWNGGDGAWDDSTGTHWNWAGTGTAAAQVGAMHDVVINPGRSATVWGSADGQAGNLSLGGGSGAIVTLQLNQGSTRVAQYASVGYGGVLNGSGRLSVGNDLLVNAGGRIEVGPGEQMQLAPSFVLVNAGLLRVQGTASAPARLELTGLFDNNGGGRMQFTHADVSLLGGGFNASELSLQDATVNFGDYGLSNRIGGRLQISFGNSTLSGVIRNNGLIAVSNGAQASFYSAVINDGELRVSAGGAANFFGLVGGTGTLTGTGQVRFEGGFGSGAAFTALRVSPQATLAAGSRLALALGAGGQHGKISFAGAVTLEGGTLALSWADGSSGAAGDSFDLFDWNGGASGRFGSLALPALGAGLAWDTHDLYTGGSLMIGAVPEPGSAALWAAGLGSMLMMARRRRRT